MSPDATLSEYNLESSKKTYEEFYKKSDFLHFGWIDEIAIKTLIQRYQMAGMNLLDVGCGTGWYTYLFNKNDVRAFGVDLTTAGIRVAKKRYTPNSYLIGNGLALPFSNSSFDSIFCSGFPPFNARKLETLAELGNKLFSLLKPGGLFIFRKTTNLSGRKGSRMNHTLQSFSQYFEDLNQGAVIGRYTASPLSWALMGPKALGPVGSKLTQIFTKATGIPLRALIIIRKQSDKEGNQESIDAHFD